eukprot:CAMPEP_0113480460 /NCGR_PEP_ID=MMETSP0014_2-20120614/21889_1 /TAXON_ID=2857 /ORGANISM="Nitzschia sp." /LENGTH=376 /DNA_ID=CAMNT_0000373895 /DNA_START=381 /DNA_END=1507 /DNA_ORIENTATION=+ /assembly_acc=CAM_ASM_000159
MNPYDDLVAACQERLERSKATQRAANKEAEEAIQALADAERKRNDFQLRNQHGNGRRSRDERNAVTATETAATASNNTKAKAEGESGNDENHDDDDDDDEVEIVVPNRKRRAIKMEQDKTGDDDVDDDDDDDEVEIVKVVRYRKKQANKTEQPQDEEESYDDDDDDEDNDDDDSYHDESDEDEEHIVKKNCPQQKKVAARTSFVSKEYSRLVAKKSNSFTKNIELKMSVGKTREQLNHLKLKCMKDCKFGQPVVCQKGGKPYAIVLNDQWNDLVEYQHEIQDWYVGASDGRLKKAEVVASTIDTQTLIPLFHSFKKGRPDPINKTKKKSPPTHIYYVGHFKVVEFKMLKPHVMFKDKIRQCLIRMQFIKFDEKTNA